MYLTVNNSIRPAEQHSSGSTGEQSEKLANSVGVKQLESGKAVTGLYLPNSKTPASRATKCPSFWDAGFSELKLEMEMWSPCPEEACYSKCQGSARSRSGSSSSYTTGGFSSAMPPLTCWKPCVCTVRPVGPQLLGHLGPKEET